MIEVYEIKPNGFIGQSKTINPREGVGSGWTYLKPSGDGPHKWENCQWVPYPHEHNLLSPGPDYSAMGDSIRQERNARIAATDWTQGKDIPDYVSAAWAPNRQALRDITAQPDFPLSVQWPETPVVVKPEPIPEPEPEQEPVVPAEETIDNTATETPPEVL
jgi:hypothetical protein